MEIILTPHAGPCLVEVLLLILILILILHCVLLDLGIMYAEGDTDLNPPYLVTAAAVPCNGWLAGCSECNGCAM